MIVQVENPIIEVHDLTVSYQQKPVLWNIDFTLPKGKLIGILGPNGAGKSTLIKSVMDLVKPDSGYVKIADQSIDSVRDRLSYVPQRESVDWDFPASAMDVVLMGRYTRKNIFKRLTKTDRAIAKKSLEQVQMQGFANRQIAQLSGGQQQRVFLARSLAQQAEIYFMDEPFAGVDATTESAIINLLMQMRSEGKTIVVVHHDLQSVQKYFDWIILLNTRLVASGPTNDIFTDTLLQETYGGKLALLSNVGDLIKRKKAPIREF